MSKSGKLKVAIVCDWLTGVGGAERVVLELHKLYPDAPIYTSQYNPKAIDWFSDADIRTTWLQKIPKRLRKFLPIFRAWSFSRLDLSKYDLVISSSGAEAKAIKTGKKTLHICYCHAPTHYYWSRYSEYLKNPGFGWLNPLARIGLSILVFPMRRWDRLAAQRPNLIITNSNYSRDQIKRYYRREATVIYPPVDTDRFKPLELGAKREGFLIAGRQTPYKRFDLAVRAATEHDLPLTVIGKGPEHSALKHMAGENITFKTKVSDSEMPLYFQKAQAFIFPGVDDFGIVAVEALAAGTPVIAFCKGGALEYVKEGKTGMCFEEQNTDSLAKVLLNFKPKNFDEEAIIKYAQTFSTEIFRSNIEKFIEQQFN